MNAIAPIGHNNPPSPIDEVLAPFADDLSEAKSWLDGSEVEDEGQLAAVDYLLTQAKAAIKAAKAGEEAKAKPLHEAWKAAKAEWKPALDELERIKSGLIACQNDFKRKKAAAQAEAERKARQEAQEAARAAAELARAAEASNIEAQRAAALAQHEAEEAQRRAAMASKDKVKGLRTVTRYAIEDPRAAVNWIAVNDREAMADFIAEYVRRNHKAKAIAGVRTWTEKEAF